MKVHIHKWGKWEVEGRAAVGNTIVIYLKRDCMNPNCKRTQYKKVTKPR